MYCKRPTSALLLFLLSVLVMPVRATNEEVSASFKINSATPEIDMAALERKVNTLRLHKVVWGQPVTEFNYQVHIITAADYQLQKPSGAYPFDAGYLGVNGNFYISEPVTTAQQAVFKNIDQVALFYLCQAFISYYYGYSPMPDFLKYGFAAFEAHLDISDEVIKTALNNYGGSVNSLSVLNNRSDFISKNGLAVSFMFGEFMGVYHCWHYYNILKTTATTIETAPWWWETETLDKLLAKWNRYMTRRLLETDENLRIKMNKETEHFRFYYRDAESFNFPAFSDTVENAYVKYTTRLGLQAGEKLTFFTIPECETAIINGVECGNRLTSGTAWESGVNSSCAYELWQLPMFARQNRHELAHTMQGLIPQGTVTAWMNEGFPGFYEGRGPFSQSVINNERQQLLDAMTNAESYFNHRPTFEETKIYPSPDYGYYMLGAYFVDFIYRRGDGDLTVKDVFSNYDEGFKKLGYPTPDDFLNAFYYDFDVRIGLKGMVSLLSPSVSEQVNENDVFIKWLPLDPSVKLNISISLNNPTSWTPLASATTQTEIIWSAPAEFSGTFYLKFSHPDYELETVFGPFTKGNQNSLSLTYPIGGENLPAGDSVSIRWASTSIPSLRINFSNDNGNSWSEIAANVPSNKRYFRWLVPSDLSDNCKIRITDMTDDAKSSESQSTFSIIKSNIIGGPYSPDENTIVLMHFDGDLSNQSDLSDDGTGIQGSYSFFPAFGSLSDCIKTTQPITISHCDNLNLDGDWTIEAWVKAEAFSTNNYQAIVTKPGDNNIYEANYTLLINPYWDNVFHYFYFSKTDSRIGITCQKPVLNEWYHVMCIRDTRNSVIKMVVRDKNLNIIDSKSQSFTGNEMYTNSKDLLICDNFNGYIDELRISNVVRKFEKPTAPVTPAPLNNSTGVKADADINLSWTNGSDTRSIDLFIDKNNPPTTKVIDNEPDVNEYVFSSVEPMTKYYWKVICRNLYGETESALWSFTTGAITGIEDKQEESVSLTVFPNPVRDKVYFTYSQISDKAVLTIYDVSGKVVHTRKTFADGKIEVDTKKLAVGLYFVMIRDNNRVYTGKFIRE